MSAEKMNASLAALYEEYLHNFEQLSKGNNSLSKPLLLHIPDGYSMSSRKLMIVGQETVGWGEDLPWSVADLMQGYADWDLGANYSASPFWVAAHRLYDRLNPQGPPRAFLWNNLIKSSENGDRPSTAHEAAVCAMPILQREIALCQPDAIVFFTGPEYDGRLTETFPGVKYSPTLVAWPERTLATLSHPELPTQSFRTYHPNYLRKSKKEQVLADLAQVMGESAS